MWEGQEIPICLPSRASSQSTALIALLACYPPERRGDREIKLIMEELKKQSYFITLVNNYKSLFEISAHVEYRYVKEGAEVYKINDFCECFYVLISGEVILTLPAFDDEEEEEEEEEDVVKGISTSIIQSFFPPPSFRQSVGTSPLSMVDTSWIPSSSQITSVELKERKEDLTVRVVDEGDCFGELAAGDVNRRGTAAVASLASHLLVIRKNLYDIISRGQLKSSNRSKYQFLSGLSLFKLIYRFGVQSFLYLMDQIPCGYNTVLYREGQPISYIYIIEKGQFKLIKKVPNGLNSKREAAYRLLNHGEILGDAEAGQEGKTFIDTCICKSQSGTVYRIEKKKFLKKLFAPQNQVDLIHRHLEQKLSRKNELMQGVVKKQTKNELFVRFLNSRGFDRKQSLTESTQRRDQIEALSLSGSNFFEKLNITIDRPVRPSRISVNRTQRFKTEVELPKRNRKSVGLVPRTVQDIVEIVDLKRNYQKLRKPQMTTALFEFDIQKVPLFVRKKYQHLFKK